MRQLVLLRHAKAAANSATGHDKDRPLAPRGQNDAPLMGKALVDAGADPQVVLVSGAKRTRETWALVAPCFPKAKVEFADSLYLAEPDILMRAAEVAGVERVMIVAHNPGLHELASHLSPRMNALESRLRAKFPTAAAAIFERKDEISSLRLKEFITPKDAVD